VTCKAHLSYFKAVSNHKLQNTPTYIFFNQSINHSFIHPLTHSFIQTSKQRSKQGINKIIH